MAGAKAGRPVLNKSFCSFSTTSNRPPVWRTVRHVWLARLQSLEHAHRLAKALARTLRTLNVLPVRTIDSLAQIQAVLADVPVLLLDAPERPYHRAQAAVDQAAVDQAAVDRAADYSGKKKAHP